MDYYGARGDHGYNEDEMELLSEQGINPWDDDAAMVLDYLRAGG